MTTWGKSHHLLIVEVSISLETFTWFCSTSYRNLLLWQILVCEVRGESALRGALTEISCLDLDGVLLDLTWYRENLGFGQFDLVVDFSDSFLGALLDEVSNVEISVIVPGLDTGDFILSQDHRRHFGRLLINVTLLLKLCFVNNSDVIRVYTADFQTQRIRLFRTLLFIVNLYQAIRLLGQFLNAMFSFCEKVGRFVCIWCSSRWT